MHVYKNNSWRLADANVKVGGVWKGVSVYVKTDGVWKAV